MIFGIAHSEYAPLTRKVDEDNARLKNHAPSRIPSNQSAALFARQAPHFLTAVYNLPTEKLEEYLATARLTLERLPSDIDREPLIQTALQELMESGKDVRQRFQQMLVDQPEVATRVLMLSISAITNLHVADNVSKSLKLRAEGN